MKTLANHFRNTSVALSYPQLQHSGTATWAEAPAGTGLLFLPRLGQELRRMECKMRKIPPAKLWHTRSSWCRVKSLGWTARFPRFHQASRRTKHVHTLPPSVYFARMALLAQSLDALLQTCAFQQDGALSHQKYTEGDKEKQRGGER